MEEAGVDGDELFAMADTELVEVELGLVELNSGVVVLNTVDVDVVTVVVLVVVEEDIVVVDVVVGMMENEGELSSMVVELLSRIGTVVVSSVSFSAGGFIVTELSIGLPLATENISIIKKSVVVTTPTDILSFIT